MANRWELSQHVIGLIDGRWTLPVLAELQNGGRRYQDLDEALDGVSHKVLTDTLRRAERDGLVVRHLDPGRVETATLYQLTELGRSLDEPLAALERWVDANWPEIEAGSTAMEPAQRLEPRSAPPHLTVGTAGFLRVTPGSLKCRFVRRERREISQVAEDWGGVVNTLGVGGLLGGYTGARLQPRLPEMVFRRQVDPF